MAIPNFQDIMRPLLEYLAREKMVVELSPLREGLVKDFPEMTEEEFARLLSNKERLFFNRIRWAISELKRAGFIRSPERAHYEITEKGQAAVDDKNAKINRGYLMEHSDEYRGWVEESIRRSKLGQSKETIETKPEIRDNEKTPDEEIDAAIQEINEALAADLLERARELSPEKFEHLAVDLLLAMDYGASGEALGRSGDGCIDGVIKQDKLGIDRIYIQAKRYSEGNNVDAREVRDFAGALEMKRMQKGIFVTTSSFTPDARQTVQQMQKHIILIDGKQLAKLMVDYNVGCTSINLVRKEVKEDYFE